MANESQRFGRVLTAADDNNELQRPVLWGTRRVGPDLTHEGGRRSNDWHMAHFWDPENTSPGSIMPEYTWFFDDGYQIFRQIDPVKAQREGIDPSREYPLPGVYPTQADAEAALERVKTETPDNLAAERDRLVVRESKGPNEIGLSITAYLQWLGTWDASKRREVQE